MIADSQENKPLDKKVDEMKENDFKLEEKLQVLLQLQNQNISIVGGTHRSQEAAWKAEE